MSSWWSSPGRARWVAPFAVLIAALGLGSLLMAPMVAMDPRDLPVAVVDLDEGADVAGTRVDAGAQLVATVVQGDADGLIAWTTLPDEPAATRALEDNDVYAVLVVPADFSASQVAAQQGAGAASPLTLVVNEGKNPMVTAQLSAPLAALAEGSGLEVVTEPFREVPDSLGLVASFLPMVFMILVYISSYATGMVIRSTVPLRDAGRGRAVGTQLLLAALAAVVVGWAGSWILTTMVDVDLSVASSAAFMAVSAFALMTLVIGSTNWAGPAGMVVPVLILALGLGTADLPYEFLPAFWQDLVYPWNPLRYLAEGARALLFQGAGWWNSATPALLVTAVVGGVLTATSVLRPRRVTARPAVTEGTVPPPALTARGISPTV